MLIPLFKIGPTQAGSNAPPHKCAHTHKIHTYMKSEPLKNSKIIKLKIIYLTIGQFIIDKTFFKYSVSNKH